MTIFGQMCDELGLPRSASFAEILDEIRKLKYNQRLPGSVSTDEGSRKMSHMTLSTGKRVYVSQGVISSDGKDLYYGCDGDLSGPDLTNEERAELARLGIIRLEEFLHSIEGEGAGSILTNALGDLVEINMELGLSAIARQVETLSTIKKLKYNQRLPDYSLGKYKNVCPHGRPLSEMCPQCYAYPGGKFRE